jgi:Transposase, Mutator family
MYPCGQLPPGPWGFGTGRGSAWATVIMMTNTAMVLVLFIVETLFTFTRLPPSQWRSARTTNAIERLHEEFKRRIKTQTVLPSAETAAMLFWALLASGQINMRKVDGWRTLAKTSIGQPIDLAA